MKGVFFLLSGLLVCAGAWAQSAEIEDLKSQHNQHQVELDKLKDNKESTNKELLMVQNQIKTTENRISSVTEKIDNLCGKLDEITKVKASNPICI